LRVSDRPLSRALGPEIATTSIPPSSSCYSIFHSLRLHDLRGRGLDRPSGELLKRSAPLTTKSALRRAQHWRRTLGRGYRANLTSTKYPDHRETERLRRVCPGENLHLSAPVIVEPLDAPMAGCHNLLWLRHAGHLRLMWPAVLRRQRRARLAWVHLPKPSELGSAGHSPLKVTIAPLSWAARSFQ
jgi:hypothetical protein